MKNLSAILLLGLFVFLAGCVEDTEQMVIEESVGPINLNATAPIITDDIAGDWVLSFDSYNLPFRVLNDADRVIVVDALGSSSGRVEIHDSKMTLTLGYRTYTVLVTADLTRSDTSVDISNIQVVLNFFDGNQYSYTGSMAASVIDSIDYGLSSFINTFSLSYIPADGNVSLLAATTITVNADGSISSSGSIISGAGVWSYGDLDWGVVFQIASDHLSLHCYESSWSISFNCNYTLTNFVGTLREEGTAQLTPTGHTMATLAGMFTVHIPGETLPAQLILNTDGSAQIQGYKNYSSGAATAMYDNGFTSITFTSGDDELKLFWYARPGLAPFQGSTRMRETISGQRNPLLAVMIEEM